MRIHRRVVHDTLDSPLDDGACEASGIALAGCFHPHMSETCTSALLLL